MPPKQPLPDDSDDDTLVFVLRVAPDAGWAEVEHVNTARISRHSALKSALDRVVQIVQGGAPDSEDTLWH
ncbi:hypothetical protein ATO10_02870 [Actibacterium atlanticum]|uniref:Uncharacterized protein n=1 Tax=Actibacterium atlanticum TaxID=1461693 RepID=A0A058ZQ35_9RHOB|nr:hypothetical protein [Actibacterium atlanticum]KCV83668.1 hypothetical protein ATO10_02870 [Actibacterium atlanticum]